LRPLSTSIMSSRLSSGRCSSIPTRYRSRKQWNSAAWQRVLSGCPLTSLTMRRPHGCGRSSPAMIKVVVCGALGRMGTTVGRLANEAPDMELVGGIDLRGGSFFGVDVTEAAQIDTLLASARPDVLIDFTAPAASV